MHSLRILQGASLLAIATGSPAFAQQVGSGAADAGAPVAAAQPAAADAATAADIVVTAQRRAQRLQEAPVAVTALSPAALQQFNISTSQDLMQVVPSLQVSTQTAADSGGSATFFLRGMGQQRSGNGSEPAVGIYVDDFYYPSLQGSSFDIVDLAQVEVLRGPQGTLFGRNTIGGAVRYSTQNAELDHFSGHLTATAGSYDRYDVSGAVNLPIGDWAAIRFTGGHLQQDGFVKVQSGGRDAGKTETNLARVQARVEPTTNLHIDLSGQYSRSKLWGFTYDVPGPLTPQPPVAGMPTLPFVYNVAVAPALGLPAYTDAYRSTCFYCQYGTDTPEYSFTTYKNALSTIGWDVGNGFTLKSLTGWQQVSTQASIDLDSTPLPLFSQGDIRARTDAFSQELQINGKKLDDRLNFVAGAFYYNERNPAILTDAPILLGGHAALTPTARSVKSYAGYFDGTFSLTSKLTLLGGYRYSEDHKRAEVYDANLALLDSGRRRFSSSTYRAGLQYQWARDVMTYVNVSTGFRAGGFNPYTPTQTPSIIPFEPEKSTSYEAGARLQFLDRLITINPTIFYVDWNNIQVQSAVLNLTTGVVDAVLQNAGKARSYGGEVEWTVQPTDHVRLFGNVAYLNIRYLDIGNATGITKDTELQRAPSLTFAIGGSHTLDMKGGGRIVSTLNYSFEDKQYSTPTLADRLLLKSYGLLNLRVEFTDADKRFSLAGFVTNLTKEKYAIGGVNYYANVGAARYDLGRPREFGVTGRFNFR